MREGALCGRARGAGLTVHVELLDVDDLGPRTAPLRRQGCQIAFTRRLSGRVEEQPDEKRGFIKASPYDDFPTLMSNTTRLDMQNGTNFDMYTTVYTPCCQVAIQAATEQGIKDVYQCHHDYVSQTRTTE